MSKRLIAFVGDYYHKKEWSMAALNEALKAYPDIEVEYGSADRIMDYIKEQPDAIILFRENRLTPQTDETNVWMDVEVETAICEYVRAGGGWLAWHSGLASYENMEKYTDMLKGYFKYHPAEHQVVTYTQVEGATITHNKDAFQLLDEHYFVHCDEEQTDVFLKSQSVDGESIAGWTHTYGEGKVVCFTPAHLQEGLLHPNVVGLLGQSVQKVIG